MIGLVVVSSELQDNRELQKEIENEIKSPSVRITEELLGLSGVVILVATGGTERKIEQIIKSTEIPVILWALPDNNSLGAVLEVYSQYKDRVMIFYGPIDDRAFSELSRFERVCDAMSKIKQSRIGLIGGISDWILTSNIEDLKKLGLDTIEIETHELLGALRREKGPASLGSYQGIDKSLEVYGALKDTTAKYGLDALSIRCFDLLKEDMTACITLALLNDEGIIAGCEGDLQTLATMLVASQFSRKVWMANVARINEKKNTITLAHCAIAPSHLSDIKLTTHMESGRGVAIHGPLKEKGRVTVFRIGGRMERALIWCADVVDSDMSYENLCRMQVEIRPEFRVKEFLKKTLGNHQVIIFEDVSEDLRELCEFMGIETIG